MTGGARTGPVWLARASLRWLAPAAPLSLARACLNSLARARPGWALVGLSVAIGCTGEAARDGGATPSTPDFARADSIVSAWTAAERVPGAVLVVAERGTVVFERAYGSAWLYDYGAGQYPSAPTDGGIERRASPAPMTTGTVFDLASVTKVMATTMAVMVLTDRGAIDVDAPVARYLPDLVGDDRGAITVRHLLTHRSGLPQWLPVYYAASDRAEAYAYLRRVPLSWPVGAERHYSDLGFMLLGELVREVSGRDLDDFLEADLYGPLGLERTGFRPVVGADAASSTRRRAGGPYAATSHGNPFERRMVHDPGFGYAIDGDPDAWSGWRDHTLVGRVNDGNAFHAFRGVAGHAGLFGTAGELARILGLLLPGASPTIAAAPTRATVDLFLAPTGDGQALGWQLPDYAPAGSFAHTGFTGTFVMGIPDRDLAIVLLTNRQNVGVDAETSYPDVGPLQRAVVAALAPVAPPPS